MSNTKICRMIRLVPGLAIPEYMSFILKYCEPIGYTRKAIKAGHILKIDYHPPYIQVKCKDIDVVIKEAQRRKLRIYRGKRHVTITDGIYKVRIYLML